MRETQLLEQELVEQTHTIPSRNQLAEHDLIGDAWYTTKEHGVKVVVATCGDPYEGVTLDMLTLTEMLEALLNEVPAK